MTRMDWNEAQVAQLRSLHGEGLPFSKICVALGITRNAALGKATRLGIIGGGKGIKLRPKKTKVNLFVLPTIIARPIRQKPIMTMPVSKHIPFLDIGFHQCRYPDDGEGPMHFCGCSTKEGSSMCAYHDYISHLHEPLKRKILRVARERSQLLELMKTNEAFY